MLVKKAIRNGWKLLMVHGDIEEIVKQSKTPENKKGISRITIGHALRTGKMNEATFECINKFYQARADKMSAAERQAIKNQDLSLNDNN